MLPLNLGFQKQRCTASVARGIAGWRGATIVIRPKGENHLPPFRLSSEQVEQVVLLLHHGPLAHRLPLLDALLRRDELRHRRLAAPGEGQKVASKRGEADPHRRGEDHRQHHHHTRHERLVVQRGREKLREMVDAAVQRREDDMECADRDVADEEQEVLAVLPANAVVDPRAVVVHAIDAATAELAVVRVVGLELAAPIAKPHLAKAVQVVDLARILAEAAAAMRGGLRPRLMRDIPRRRCNGHEVAAKHHRLSKQQHRRAVVVVEPGGPTRRAGDGELTEEAKMVGQQV